MWEKIISSICDLEIVSFICDNLKSLISENIFEILFLGAVLILIFLGKRIWNAVSKMLRWMANKFIYRIRDEVVRSFVSTELPRIIRTLKQELGTEIQELQPPPPPQGISGTLCPESGLYFSQQYPEVQQVFGKGDTLTEAQDSMGRYVKTYWVRVDPATHTHWIGRR